MNRPTFYGRVVAAIHNQGFARFVDRATPDAISILREAGIDSGLVLDLGCGGGQTAARLLGAGFTPWGLDISPAMVREARHRVRSATFVCGSVTQAPLPGARAALALGEVLSYLSGPAQIRQTFRRVFGALGPGGLFLFDLCVARPRARTRSLSRTICRQSQDWAIMATIADDPLQMHRQRDITAFWRSGHSFSRADETHRQRIYRVSQVLRWLRHAGFVARARRGYGSFLLDNGRRVFQARRP